MDYERLNEQLDSLRATLGGGQRRELAEADEIEFSQLPRAQQNLMKAVGLRPSAAFHGIHGYIVGFHANPIGTRFPKSTLQKLVRSKVFRWLEFHRDGSVAIGM